MDILELSKGFVVSYRQSEPHYYEDIKVYIYCDYLCAKNKVKNIVQNIIAKKKVINTYIINEEKTNIRCKSCNKKYKITEYFDESICNSQNCKCGIKKKYINIGRCKIDEINIIEIDDIEINLFPFTFEDNDPIFKLSKSDNKIYNPVSPLIIHKNSQIFIIITCSFDKEDLEYDIYFFLVFLVLKNMLKNIWKI